MELKKKGDLVYTLIKTLTNKERLQFKKFLTFEYEKPEKYIKMADVIYEFCDDWIHSDAFPENLFKEKCDADILKSFSKNKLKLKQSIINYKSYLVSSNNELNPVKNYSYFVKKLALNFQILLPAKLDELVTENMEELATESFDVDMYDLNNFILVKSFMHVSYSSFDKEVALEKIISLQSKLETNKKIFDNYAALEFYISLFHKLTDEPLENVEKYKNEIDGLENLKIDFSNITNVISYYQAKEYLYVYLNDKKKRLETNLDYIAFFEKQSNLSVRDQFYLCGVKSNTAIAANENNDPLLSKRLLKELEIFLAENETFAPGHIQMFTLENLSGKIMHNIYFEKNSNIILDAISAMENATSDKNVILRGGLQEEINLSYVYSYFIIKDYKSCYELIDSMYKNEDLNSLTLACYLIAQFHLFDLDFLNYSFRNLLRIIKNKNSYSKIEIKKIAKIMSLLKKLKVSNNKLERNEVSELILSFKDDFYLFVHQRIADEFVKVVK